MTASMELNDNGIDGALPSEIGLLSMLGTSLIVDRGLPPVTTTLASS